MQLYSSLVEAIDALRAEGYTEDFNILPDSIECREKKLRLSPDDLQVDKFFRFEGMTNPSDSSILYAISSEKYGLKGVLVNGYGVSSDPLTAAMARKLG